MDVQSWLQKTADRAPPDPSDEDLGIPAFLARPHRTHSEAGRPTAARKSRHKRHRVSGDSSIVVPRPVSRSHRHVAHAPPFAEPARDTGGRPASSPRRRESSDDSAADPSLSEVEEVAPKKSYERRPRHKTRADRYEPKAKKRKSKYDEEVDEPRIKKQRKARGTNNGERTAELVQKFALKNGLPKNKRLTLKADDSKRGLFKHGKSSDQIAGRGTGLPDLVFNEMRFLQRPKDHQDEPAAKEPGKKRLRKEDRDRKQQEEISAYFVDKKSKEHRATDPTHADTNLSRYPGDRHRDRSHSKICQSKREVEAPPVDLPDRPFLGFGSRGARPSSRYSSGNTTPCSRSESQQRRPAVGEVQRSRSVQQTDDKRPRQQHVPDEPQRRRRTDPGLLKQDAVDDADDAEAQAVSHAALTRQPRDTNIPSSVPTYEQAVPKPAGQDDGGLAVGTARRSLPSITIAGRQSHHIDKGARDDDDPSQPDDRTSDILRVRFRKLGSNIAVARPCEEDRLALDQPANDASSSSPTSKLLRQAEDASNRPLGLAESNSVPPRHNDLPLDHAEVNHTHAVQQCLGPSQNHQNVEPHVGALPSIDSLPSHARQPASIATRKYQPRESFPPPTRSLHLEPWQTPHQCTTNAMNDDEDEEMLDNGNTEALYQKEQYYTPVAAYHAEPSEAIPSTSSNLTRASLAFEYEGASHAASARLANRFDAGSRGLLTSTRQASLSVHESNLGGLNDLAGFWKPHRLY